MPTEADLLADLLDGNVDAADVPADIAELASLAESVSRHVTLVPPTDAFRDALRDEVLQSAGGAAGAGGATATTATTATTAATGGGLSAVVAGIAATAVLATSTVAAADRAGPGDLLSGLDRGVESVQLAIAADEREAELLVDFAAERVLEAVDMLDPAAVSELLQQAETLVDDALALGADQVRELEELLEPYRAALVTLASRSEDPAVQTQVAQLLEEAGVGRTPVRPSGPDGAGDTPAADEPDDGGAGLDVPEGSGDPGDRPSDGLPAEPAEPRGDPDEPLDDLRDPLDEPLGDLDEPLDELDPLDEPLEDLGEPLGDASDELGNANGGVLGG